MNIRPLTREDLTTWWPDVPLPRTVRGFAAEQDGRLYGISGLMYLHASVVAFAEMVDEGQKYPLSIMRMVRLMKGLMTDVKAPIFAVADERYPNSQAFLEHVGFERVVGRQFVFRR